MSEQEVSRVFAINLRHYMTSNHINQKELAAKLGVSESSVSNWLHTINVPRTGVLQKLTEIFGCKPSDLLTDHGGQKTSPPSEEDELDQITRDTLSLLKTCTDDERRMYLNILRAMKAGGQPQA